MLDFVRDPRLIHESSHCRVFRARLPEGAPVIVKVIRHKRWTNWPGTIRQPEGLPGTTGLFVATDYGPKWRAVVGRIDQWGHRGCIEGGTCVGKTAGSCDDSDQCTFDYCNFDGGCAHTKLTGCK